MKQDCERFLEELATSASAAAELSNEAAAHVRNCARCRAKIPELKAVAYVHRAAAAKLAEPKRRLGRPQLEGALANTHWATRDFGVPWRAVLAGAAVVVLIISGAFAHRIFQRRVDRAAQAEREQGRRQAVQEAFEPTMLALHHEVEGGRELLLAGTAGVGMRPYRLKDAASEP
jgi:hypothetical protein